MKKRILIADDDPAILKMTRLRLEHAGFDVVTVGNGQAALAYVLRGDRIDLVLIDVRMPKLDGFHVCQQLKENPTTARIPIIVISGSESRIRHLADRCIELGVTDWLRKPYRSKELLEKIGHALGETEAM